MRLKPKKKNESVEDWHTVEIEAWNSAASYLNVFESAVQIIF